MESAESSPQSEIKKKRGRPPVGKGQGKKWAKNPRVKKGGHRRSQSLFVKSVEVVIAGAKNKSTEIKENRVIQQALIRW